MKVGDLLAAAKQPWNFVGSTAASSSSRSGGSRSRNAAASASNAEEAAGLVALVQSSSAQAVVDALVSATRADRDAFYAGLSRQLSALSNDCRTHWDEDNTCSDAEKQYINTVIQLLTSITTGPQSARLVPPIDSLSAQAQAEARPPQLVDTLTRLSVVALELNKSAPALSTAASRVAETWIAGNRVASSQLAPTTTAFLLRNVGSSSEGGITPNEVKRLLAVRAAFRYLDLEAASSDWTLRKFLLAFTDPALLGSADGRRVLSFFLTLSPVLACAAYKVILHQLPDASRGTLGFYGEIFGRAWTDLSRWSTADSATAAAATGKWPAGVPLEPAVAAGLVATLQQQVLQDMARRALESKHEATAAAMLTVLSVGFHERRGAFAPMSAMLAELYAPLLWRALEAPNSAVRHNAAQVLVSAFPVMDDRGGDRAKIEQETNRHLDKIKKLLGDAHVPTREAALDAVARALTLWAEILPLAEVKTLLQGVVALLTDAAAASVRAAALATLSRLVDLPALTKPLLAVVPSAAALLWDRSERVQLAAVRMLCAFRSLRTFSLSDAVSDERLLARFQSAGPTLADALLALLRPVFLPADAAHLGERMVAMLRLNSAAAKRFYASAGAGAEPAELFRVVAVAHGLVARQFALRATQQARRLEARSDNDDDNDDNDDGDDVVIVTAGKRSRVAGAGKKKGSAAAAADPDRSSASSSASASAAARAGAGPEGGSGALLEERVLVDLLVVMMHSWRAALPVPLTRAGPAVVTGELRKAVGPLLKAVQTSDTLAQGLRLLGHDALATVALLGLAAQFPAGACASLASELLPRLLALPADAAGAELAALVHCLAAWGFTEVVVAIVRVAVARGVASAAAAFGVVLPPAVAAEAPAAAAATGAARGSAGASTKGAAMDALLKLHARAVASSGTGSGAVEGGNVGMLQLSQRPADWVAAQAGALAPALGVRIFSLLLGSSTWRGDVFLIADRGQLLALLAGAAEVLPAALATGAAAAAAAGPGAGAARQLLGEIVACRVRTDLHAIGHERAAAAGRARRAAERSAGRDESSDSEDDETAARRAASAGDAEITQRFASLAQTAGAVFQALARCDTAQDLLCTPSGGLLVTPSTIDVNADDDDDAAEDVEEEEEEDGVVREDEDGRRVSHRSKRPARARTATASKDKTKAKAGPADEPEQGGYSAAWLLQSTALQCARLATEAVTVGTVGAAYPLPLLRDWARELASRVAAAGRARAPGAFITRGLLPALAKGAFQAADFAAAGLPALPERAQGPAGAAARAADAEVLRAQTAALVAEAVRLAAACEAAGAETEPLTLESLLLALQTAASAPAALPAALAAGGAAAAGSQAQQTPGSAAAVAAVLCAAAADALACRGARDVAAADGPDAEVVLQRRRRNAAAAAARAGAGAGDDEEEEEQEPAAAGEDDGAEAGAAAVGLAAAVVTVTKAKTESSLFSPLVSRLLRVVGAQPPLVRALAQAVDAAAAADRALWSAAAAAGPWRAALAWAAVQASAAAAACAVAGRAQLRKPAMGAIGAGLQRAIALAGSADEARGAVEAAQELLDASAPLRG